jgi:hypothetical protein
MHHAGGVTPMFISLDLPIKSRSRPGSLPQSPWTHTELEGLGSPGGAALAFLRNSTGLSALAITSTSF